MKKLFRKIVYKFFSWKNPASRYCVRLKRKYRLKKFSKAGRKVIEIGGGKFPLSRESINVDALDYHTVDLIENISNGLSFASETIDEIITVAVLEHLSIVDLKKVLKEFYRVLKKGGQLTAAVPSLNKIFDYYKINGCDDLLLRFLHGAQKDEYDVHLAVLDYERFKKELEEADFRQVKDEPYDFPLHRREFMMKLKALK